MKHQAASAINRRRFIRQAACAALGAGAMSAAVRDLRLMNAAVAQTPISDYKALVCLFLNGGNDGNNLIIPAIASEHADYSAIRTNILAVPLSGAPNVVLPISPLTSDGHDYGMHPACPELVTLFHENKLAILFNTGTLVYPMTRVQYQSGLLEKPSQLFSHSDQIEQWQTSVPDRTTIQGWGGRCADLLASLQPNAPISLCVTLAGANTFEVGNSITPYSVTSSGAVSLGRFPTESLQTLTNILQVKNSNLQVDAYAKVAAHAIETADLLNDAIAPTTDKMFWTTPFPTTVTTPTSNFSFSSGLAGQLRMVARLIEAGARSTVDGGFGMKRQIFFCSVGGYDLHAGQTPGPGQAAIGAHANLLAELSQNMFAFQRAIEQLGLSSNVTTFTASDFGRTFPCNGVGSDHGWGNHHLIMGGAVNGRRTFGRWPTLAVNGPDDTTTGRWIPTTAIDQYFATIATWFGVDSNGLTTVFPNLSRFATPNLGFV